MLEDAAEKGGSSAPLFTLMPDHVHILVLGLHERSDAITAIDRFMDLSGWWFYQRGNRPKWQKGDYDHIVRAAEGWERQACCIALNPVRASLTEDPYDWPFTGSIGYDVRDVLGDAFWWATTGFPNACPGRG